MSTRSTGRLPQFLTEREKQMLDFAGRTYRYEGARENDIRELFGLTATAYHQQLNVLLDKPEALAYAPTLVKRLLDRRRRTRAAHFSKNQVSARIGDT